VLVVGNVGPVVISVEGLTKSFRVHRREPGLASSLRSLVKRTYVSSDAVWNVSFSVAAGEIVGFLGPNGAGKTTTLKCLSGLLHPDAGSVRVLGFEPFQRKAEFLKQITLVLGQRTSLLWDLPASDAFAVNKAIYRIPERDYRAALDELVELLALAPLLTKQVRALSLGERMRCELAGALLHHPQILFLDEPTLGLDVNGQVAIRSFLARYNATYGATVLLTSHYMGDMTALAKRVLVIDKGSLRFDGDLHKLVEDHSPFRVIRVTLRNPSEISRLSTFGDVVATDGVIVSLRVPRANATAIVTRVLLELAVDDVAISDEPIEDVIRAVFAGA
jgi:ABC-2 type transport system ATP-binding protein